MKRNRRQFLTTALGGAALLSRARQARAQAAYRIGMCDWSLGRTEDITALDLAKDIGLDGVEASLSFSEEPGSIRLRKARDAYLARAKELKLDIPSIALGGLNNVPLRTEELAAQLVGEAVTVAADLGARNILIPFFGLGELKITDSEGVDHVVAVLKELAPAAEKAGVVLGLESYLAAADCLTILERVGSEAVRVYYDCRNSANKGYDVPAEIRQLGDRICQVHLKNEGLMLSQKDNVDFPACAKALSDIGYKGWLVLETSSPSGDTVKDTQANMAYVREVFTPPA